LSRTPLLGRPVAGHGLALLLIVGSPDNSNVKAAQRVLGFMTQDSNTRGSFTAIPTAWRSMRLRARKVLGRFKTVRCSECLRLIRWWHRRVWLVNGESGAHLECSKGRMLLTALVAREIRRFQVITGETQQTFTSPADSNRPEKNELREVEASAESPSQTVEQTDASQPQIAELTHKRTLYKANSNGDSPLLDLAGQVWRFLGQLVPHAASRPVRLCMLCGGVEFNATSVICSKCGTSLRP
jgi:hypothetical protein